MSRAAASMAAKKDQKAALADKNAEKDRQAALGMTPAYKRMIGTDTVVCMECGATEMGPTKCECKGGKRRPTADYEPIPALLEAAKTRHAATQAADRLAAAANQGQVAKERQKNKEARDADKNDLDKEFQGDGVEILQMVEFPVGKLGMDIYKNAVIKSEGPAEELSVKVGWIIATVNDTNVPANKKAIIAEAVSCMKKGPVKFGFRVPITAGFYYCGTCDKFLEEGKFDPSQLSDKGPGKQMCASCEEFADMGF